MEKTILKKIAWLTVLVFYLVGIPLVWAMNQDDDIAVIERTSKAFANIAKKAIPTVFAYFGIRYILEPALAFGIGLYFKVDIDMYLPLGAFGDLVTGPKDILNLGMAMPDSSGGAQLPESLPFLIAGLYFVLIWGAIYALVKTRRFH